MEEKQEKISQEWGLSKASSRILLAQVLVRLKHCIEVHDMLADTLDKTLDLALELQLSGREQ